jgi:16S rRNA (cytosine1402-N4)-methyltransferase
VFRPHEPVLVAEVLEYLVNGPGLYLDATLGDGGHALALLDAEPGARLLGCDRDPAALAAARTRLAGREDRVTLAHAAFRELPTAHERAGGEPLTGVLMDLGISSRQLDDPTRGIGFQAGGPLDLRMDPTRGEPASERLARASEEEVAEALREFGDLRPARRMARALVAAARGGSLVTAADLDAIARRFVGGAPGQRARVFQALRMWINDEAGELEALLSWLPGVVRPGGVVVTLAYHSGEDRRIKRSLVGTVPAPPRRRPPVDTRLPEQPWERLTRRVVTPQLEEIARNPRARSARLRAFRRRDA